MRHGFKTWAERQAAEQRRMLNLSSIAPLAAERLAKRYNVAIQSPKDVPGMPLDYVEWLLRNGPSDWSAVTLHTVLGRLILLNTAHSAPRQQSDVMHEIAHLICDHKPTTVISLKGSFYSLRGYDAEQEEEASWLGACLQLPRPALAWAAARRMTTIQIADHFLASVELVRYRWNKTGIVRQYGQRTSGL